jgi:hypothetical protein
MADFPITINNSTHGHAAQSGLIDRRLGLFALGPTTNIATGGNTATTFQLTPPSGKTTADFQTGKISDDTNPVPSLDLASGKYTELEFSVQASNSVSNNQIFQFRISSGGTALDSYSVTPQWTIGALTASLSPNNANHGHTAQAETLSQKHVLTVQNCRSLHSSSLTSFGSVGSTHRFWDASVGATEYYLYYGTASGVYNGVGATEGDSPIHVGNVTNFTINNLPLGVTYYFVVSAINASGESAYSNQTAETIGQAITVANATDSQTAAQDTLSTSGISFLSANNCLHSHAAAQAVVFSTGSFLPNDSRSLHSVQSTSFAQKHILGIQNAGHIHISGNLNLGALVLEWPSGYVTLVEIDFTTGTRYYSYQGVSAPGNWYKDQLVEIGSINREVPALPGEYRIAETDITLSNLDQEFSILKAVYPFRNRIVRIKFGDLTGGLSGLTTIYTGAISDWRFEGGMVHLTVRDISYDPLRTSLGGFANQLNFSDCPSSDRARFMPILYGEVSSVGRSGTGAAPCILTSEHTPFRYLVARHVCKSIDNVYLYGQLLDPSSYTVSTSSVGGVTMQFIEFVEDQRDSFRLNEPEITADVKGITDNGLATGTLLENPADQLKHYLVNYAGIDINKMDSSFATTANYMTLKAYKGAVAVLDDDPHSNVIERFMESFGMSFYCNRTGGYGLFIFDLNSLSDLSALDLYSDNLDILKDSFEVRAQQEVCSRMQFNYVYNWPGDYFEQQPDQIDSAEVTNLGQDIRENTNLYYCRDDGTALAVVNDRMSLMRESSQLASFDLPISRFNLDLNSLVKVTHGQGIAASGSGYQGVAFRILQLGINVQPTGMKVSASGIRPILVGDVWASYIKLGDETQIASSWNNATASDKKYGYLGDENNSTGSPKGTLGVNDPIKLLY